MAESTSGFPDWRSRAHPAQPWQEVITGTPETITCPVCGMTSYNQTDVAQGYCGNCHDWTATWTPERAARRRALNELGLGNDDD